MKDPRERGERSGGLADYIGVDMTQPKPENYEYAQQLIASELWRVDPGLGVVYGVKGRPFTRQNSWGYIQIKFRHPADWRAECAVLAHRVIWEFVHGAIALDLTINHINGTKTDNRLVNLEAVSLSANVRHAYQVGLKQSRKGEAHRRARLTEQQVRDIYRRCWAGEKDTPLAVEYGVSREAINNIRNGWGWRHVTGHQRSTQAER